MAPDAGRDPRSLGTRPGSPLRVLYVNHVSAISGAEKSLLGLLAQLNRQLVSPMLASPTDGPLGPAALQMEIPQVVIPALRLHRSCNPVNLCQQWRLLRRSAAALTSVARRCTPDLIHCNSLIAALVASRARLTCPFIWHARDLRGPGPAVRAAAGAARIIAISRAVADWVQAAAPLASRKITVIYNGLDPAEVRPRRPRQEVRQELGLPETAPVIGMVAQPIPWKRHDVFLRLGAELRRDLPDLRLVIAGGDLFGEAEPYLHGLHRLARQLGVAEQIAWTGYREDIENVLGVLDVLVHPAESEPLGRVLLEAMAVGIPCVAVGQAGPAEIIQHGHSGLLAPPGDVLALAAAARQVLTDKTLAARLKQGGRERLQDFRADQMAAAVQKLYLDLIATEQPGGWSA